MMHDGMPCGLIQGQGHVALKVRNSAIFNGSWQMTADSLTSGQYLVQAGFLTYVLVFVSRDFELERTWLAGSVDRQSRTALIFSVYRRLLDELR